ncbi:hypothetical protein KJ937_03755 [Patescibacteria group bacterium]|nr:hypothetical protein [Patescibacteria group bacterium]MBU2509641.1 hypothetical protein [Patescibacteria group bacterium]
MNKKLSIIIIGFLLLAIVSLISDKYFITERDEKPGIVIKDDPIDSRLIGGTRDEHGCLGPAGYSFDRDAAACTRSWEITSVDQKKAVNIAIGKVGPSKAMTVVQVDEAPCPGCFVVHLERYYERMIVTLKAWDAISVERPI